MTKQGKFTKIDDSLPNILAVNMYGSMMTGKLRYMKLEKLGQEPIIVDLLEA